MTYSWKKVGFEEIFQLLKYKGISELFFLDAIPSLKLSFNPHQVAVPESLNRQGGQKVHTRKSPVSAIFFHYEQQKHTKVPWSL